MSYLVAFVMFCNNTMTASWTSSGNRTCVSELLRCHQVLSEKSKTVIDEERAGRLCIMYDSDGGTGAWRDEITNKKTRKKWGLDK